MDEYQRLLDLPPFDKFDLFLVIIFSIIAGVISETISYYLLYKREDYLIKHNEAIQIYEKISFCTYLDVHPKFMDRNNNKQINNITELELNFIRKLNEIKNLKHMSTIITGLTFMALMPVLMSIFEATPVGKLPFVPFKFMLYFTRSDLPGSDLTDVSPAFIYTIVLMLTKNNIKSYLGFAQPGGSMGEMILKSKLKEKGIEI